MGFEVNRRRGKFDGYEEVVTKIDVITERSCIVTEGGYPVEQSSSRGFRCRFGGVNECFDDCVMRDGSMARCATGRE